MTPSQVMNISKESSTNFSSYDEVEAPENYPTLQALEDYRDSRLAAFEKYLPFLKQQQVVSKDTSIVELGSGNSALLYTLEKHGLLSAGTAIELSKSRYNFAEMWKADKGFAKVVNINSDFSKVEYENSSQTAFFIINDTLTYLEPENEKYPDMVFQTAHRTLKKQGKLVVEVPNGDHRDIVELKAKGSRNFWHENAESNPFKYSLYRQTYSPETNRVKNESRYISRNFSEKNKVEYSFVYDKRVLTALAEKYGFANLRWFGSLTGDSFVPSLSPHVVLIAEQP